MAWITMIPSSADQAEPRPPKSEVPPMTAAAIAFASPGHHLAEHVIELLAG